MGLSALGLLLGCSGGRVFDQVNDVAVQYMDPMGGVVNYHIDDLTMPELRACLRTTKPVAKAELEDKQLRSTYVLQVTDSSRKRGFELVSKRNMRDSNGNFYYNDCLFSLIRKAEKKQ